MPPPTPPKCTPVHGGCMYKQGVPLWAELPAFYQVAPSSVPSSNVHVSRSYFTTIHTCTMVMICKLFFLTATVHVQEVGVGRGCTSSCTKHRAEDNLCVKNVLNLTSILLLEA